MMPLFLASAISDWLPSSVHSVFPGGIRLLVDGAIRALLVACVVGAALRILAARDVPAQKTAWGLVLAGTLLLPVLAPWAGNATWLPASATWVVPAHAWSQSIRSRVGALLTAKATAEAPHASMVQKPAAAADSTQGPAGQVERIELGASGATGADRFPAPTISYGQTAGVGGPAQQPTRRWYYLPFSDLVWLIYGSVCLALLLRLAYGLGGAVGLWQSAEPVRLNSHLTDGLHLRSSAKISSPVTVGSAVVLPADYDEWDTEKLRIVLAHERSHVRQGDFYLQALAGLYTAIFWFSPLGWWLKRKLSDLSEAISDHAGLEEADSHASYARILLEFAALPRRVQVGVAMAHSGRISERIERLLNENSFRQAFTGGRRRLWAALLLVPAVLFAAAALIRVQAAVTLQHPAILPGPVIGQAHPESVPDGGPAAAPAVPPAMPEAVDGQAPATPEPAPSPVPAPAPQAAPNPGIAPAPPSPPNENENQDESDNATTVTRCDARNTNTETSSATHVSTHRGYSYSYSDDGDSYALLSGKDQHARFSGDWHNGEIDKARAMAHGDFLWFSHDGKSYVVDDPQTIAEVQEMYKPMEDLGRKQEELGRQQAELGRQQAELGRRQQQASIPTPDISHEMADLNAAIAKLQSKKDGTITMEQLSEVQGRIGELQGKLGGLQGKIGARQGELGRQQGELGRQQGELGRQQGELGHEQGRLAREADHKVKSVIDESLKNGRARQVQ